MNAGQADQVPRQTPGQPVQMNLCCGRGLQHHHHRSMQVASSHHGMGPVSESMRRAMRRKIFECLRQQEKNSGSHSLMKLAEALETGLHKMHPTKADYHAMFEEPIEKHLQDAIRFVSSHGQQRQQMLHQTSNSSSYGTMVPSLDTAQSANGKCSRPYIDNMRGSMSNGYQDPFTSVPRNATAISDSSGMCPVSMQRQITHMVPTPGYRNLQILPVNPEYSKAAGYLNGKPDVMQQMQEKQPVPFSINQSSYPMQHLGTHAGSGLHSRMLESSSLYGLLDAQSNGDMGFPGSNVHLTNTAAASETFMNLPPYGSWTEKPLQQEFNWHYPQGTPISDGASEKFHGTVTSMLTPMGNQSVNAARMLSDSSTKSTLLISQSTKQPLQPKPLIKAEVLDQELSDEQLWQQKHPFKPIRTHSQFVQNQGVFPGIMSLKQQQLGSGREERLSAHGVLAYDELMYSEAATDDEKRDQSSQQFLYQNIPIQVASDSQHLLSPHVTNNISKNKQIQDDFCQRTSSQCATQQPVSSDCLNSSCATTSIDPRLSKLSTSGSEHATDKHNPQLRWFLLFIHAKFCPGPLGSCKLQDCANAKETLKHSNGCQIIDCSYKLCRLSKEVINHYSNCDTKQRLKCSKARESQCHYQNKCSNAEQSLITEPNTIKSINNGVHGDGMDIDLVAVQSFDDQPSPSKRLRLQPGSDGAHDPVRQTCPGFGLEKSHPKHFRQDKSISTKQELNMEVDMQPPRRPEIISLGTVIKTGAVQSYEIPGVSSELGSHVEQDNWLLPNKDTHESVIDNMKDPNVSVDATVSKTGKTKRKGISLMELFTPEQIYEHILSLRQWVGQSKAKAEKNQAMVHSENENSCQLCKVEKLTFEPTPKYCSPCGGRIKRNAPYYVGAVSESGLYSFCVPCYNESRSESILVNSNRLLKSKLEKRRNDDEHEEGWVACDKCKRWQHQICALFNAKRNDEEKDAEYTCHNSYIQEINHGLRTPLPQSAIPGAKDLPRTVLSDHIENHLSQRLKEERHNRANKYGKGFNEVPGADGLVVRVVSSVDKKLEVKPHFSEIFQEDNYPTEFPYKSKAILLFQRIESVEVCVFGMYVQEFGAECAFPDQRRVYLSYLDSVKYFRPEVKTISGEALRTFVYHEILIGYLQYCKQRGFTSCYIWACPPFKGEDYIMYCHPEIQKTPKSDKLREWYLSMLRKATKEGIAVEVTNLYDHFFVPERECKAKVTAARLPYFDGDYWPGAAEDMINQIRLPEDDRNLQKKGKIKKVMTKRALKAAGLYDLSGNASKDAMLMQKLGEAIYPMKEDLIMVHLQYSCRHCCILMVCGRRWVCNQCRNFSICDKCYNVELQRQDTERHPCNSTDLHTLHPVEIDGVPKDTKDTDDNMESEFFNTRQAFLSLCQGNHYQYDTLRSAKHSTMMLLYHLHNPTDPAFITTCNICKNDIKTGHGWRCKECDYDECATCYKQNAGANHAHELTKHLAGADRNDQNSRQKRVAHAQVMLRLLEHAVACSDPGFCQYPNCRKLKGVFYHGKRCEKRASGGCRMCKHMWNIIRLHVGVCKEPQCKIPRCRDLKEHTRRLQLMQRQYESRRRAAVNEMVMQQQSDCRRQAAGIAVCEEIKSQSQTYTSPSEDCKADQEVSG